MMMKVKRNINRAAGAKVLPLMMAALVFLQGGLRGAEGMAPRREGTMILSDGTALSGTLLLTPGSNFSMTTLNPGEDIAASKGYNQIRKFNMDVIKEMTFTPYKETYDRHFVFENEASDKRIFSGEPYPISELQCTVVFNNGEEFTGVLTSTVMYLKEKDPDTGMIMKNSKHMLAFKVRGESGQKHSDLIYVKRIRMLDEGAQIEKSLGVELLAMDPASVSDLKAVTQKSLSTVPVKASEGNKQIEVQSTLGENIFLAARIGDRYVAGWPEEGTKQTDLFKSIEKEMLKKEDFYNERKLLGIIPSADGRQVLTLLSLRRRPPADAAGYAGAFERDKDGNLMHFFRLSIWRWGRDPETGAMALADRVSFYRVRIDEKADTPPAGICPDLWPILKEDGKILVGKKKEVKP